MRRLLTIVLIAVGAALALPLPAGAGGPTSVLVTDPQGEQATALYYSDPGYADLEELLTGGEPLQEQPGRLGARAVNVTWMIHDAQPWRTQQLYPEAEGGPVVATYDSELTGDGGQVTWTRVADGQALSALLDRVLSPGSPQEVGADAPAAEPAVSKPVTRTETAWFSLTGWRWVFPGLVVGAGMATIAVLAARRRPRDPEPRVVLTPTSRRTPEWP